MQLDIVSDTVCPWCYIGKRRLERALAMRPHVSPEICWRPFQLAPDLPAKGLPRDSYLESKFGSIEKAAAIYEEIAKAGKEEGIDFAFERIERAPNTLDSHRLIRWAGSAGCQDAVVEALFTAYFLEGRDISDHEILAEIASQSGMDAGLVARLLAEGRDRDLVGGEAAQARRMGVSGVPSFVFDNAYVVSGAQSPEVLAQVIDRLGGAKVSQAEA